MATDVEKMGLGEVELDTPIITLDRDMKKVCINGVWTLTIPPSRWRMIEHLYDNRGFVHPSMLAKVMDVASGDTVRWHISQFRTADMCGIEIDILVNGHGHGYAMIEHRTA